MPDAPSPLTDGLTEAERAQRRDQAREHIADALTRTWPHWRRIGRRPDMALAANIAVDALGDLAAEILVDGTLFKSMTVKDGQLVMSFEPSRDMVLMMCGAMRGMLDHHGAENYLEGEAEVRPGVSLDIAHGQTGESYTFTVQRRHRPTPHEFRQRAEKQVAAVLAECDAIVDERDGQHDEDDDGMREAVRRIRAAAGVTVPDPEPDPRCAAALERFAPPEPDPDQ